MNGKTDGEDVDVTAYFSRLGICFHVQVKFHEGRSGKQAIEQVSMAKKPGTMRRMMTISISIGH
jgi:hypothetical protein